MLRFISTLFLIIITFTPFLKAYSTDHHLTKTENQTPSDIAIFTPPTGWQTPDSQSVKLPPRVLAMVIGKAPTTFPPSINLSSESYQGTLKQYLAIVKRMNEEKGYKWKEMGSIKTQSGTASLSQVDTRSQWGDVRLMHTILLKNGTIYIMTASALKSEFSQFYQDFFNSMRSLTIKKETLETDTKINLEKKTIN